MIFSMVLPRTPKSVQAKGQAGYQSAIKKVAETNYSEQPISADRLYIRIIWFARKDVGPDVDNIIKPIADALQGVVYRNDRQIAQCFSMRIDLEKIYEISNDNISSEMYREVIATIDAKRSDVTYIEVGALTAQQVIFGPIDGGAT
jgi:Holliday junction resolvase RusA-like endonuclease